MHPLNGKPRLEGAKTSDIERLLDAPVSKDDTSRPSKRRRCGESSLDLPKLPTVKSETKRLRIPPTLSGLHQPPPDARLLPSISTEQPSKVPKPAASERRTAEKDGVEPAGVPTKSDGRDDLQSKTAKASTKKRKHRKWSEEETAALLKGVARFGIGNWTKILKCDDYDFGQRTAIDLKDRFRVCCPDKYLSAKEVKKSKAEKGCDQSQTRPLMVDHVTPSPWAKKSERLSPSQIEKLGIDGSFERSGRRQRTNYSHTEDEALLRGFRKLGHSWAAIRKDENILAERTATDLRDRFRTRYSDEYASSGLAPKAESKMAKSSSKIEGPEKGDHGANGSGTSVMRTKPKPTYLEKGDQAITADSSKPLPTALLSNPDDAFWEALLSQGPGETENITLDRQILDWPFDLPKSKGNELDSLSTLNLPRPTVSNTAPQPVAGPGMQTNLLAPLPSLADMTAISDSMDFIDQLELPSLLGGFGTLEGDARAHLMNLEELLS